jgi:hypothetical protein
VNTTRAAEPDATSVAEVVPARIAGSHVDPNAGFRDLCSAPRTPADGASGSAARPATPTW